MKRILLILVLLSAVTAGCSDDDETNPLKGTKWEDADILFLQFTDSKLKSWVWFSDCYLFGSIDYRIQAGDSLILDDPVFGMGTFSFDVSDSTLTLNRITFERSNFDPDTLLPVCE